MTIGTAIQGYVAIDVGNLPQLYKDNNGFVPCTLETGSNPSNFSVCMYNTKSGYLSTTNSYITSTVNIGSPIIIKVPSVVNSTTITNSIQIVYPTVYYNNNTFKNIVFNTTIVTRNYNLNSLILDGSVGGLNINDIFTNQDGTVRSIVDSTYGIFTLSGQDGDISSTDVNPFTNSKSSPNTMASSYISNAYSAEHAGFFKLQIIFNTLTPATSAFGDNSLFMFSGYIANDFLNVSNPYLDNPSLANSTTGITGATGSCPYQLANGATGFVVGPNGGYSILRVYNSNGSYTTTNNSTPGTPATSTNQVVNLTYRVSDIDTEGNYTITIVPSAVYYLNASGNSVRATGVTFTAKSPDLADYVDTINLYKGLTISLSNGAQPIIFKSVETLSLRADYYRLQIGSQTIPPDYDPTRSATTNPFTSSIYGNSYLGTSASTFNSSWVCMWVTDGTV